jgi:hypothetical protein
LRGSGHVSDACAFTLDGVVRKKTNFRTDYRNARSHPHKLETQTCVPQQINFVLAVRTGDYYQHFRFSGF